MEHAIGNGLYHDQDKHEFGELPMTQYEALMQRMAQLQNAFDRQMEKEEEKAIFIAEAKFRLAALEKRIEIDSSRLGNLTDDIFTIRQRAEQFPEEMKNQWKGASFLTTTVVLVVSAVWSVGSAVYWLYGHLAAKP